MGGREPAGGVKRYIAAFPKAGCKAFGPVKQPYAFVPSGYTDLASVIQEFGAPRETQEWPGLSADPKKTAPMVSWWARAGLACDDAGTITFVLVREAKLPETAEGSAKGKE